MQKIEALIQEMLRKNSANFTVYSTWHLEDYEQQLLIIQNNKTINFFR